MDLKLQQFRKQNGAAANPNMELTKKGIRKIIERGIDNYDAKRLFGSARAMLLENLTIMKVLHDTIDEKG